MRTRSGRAKVSVAALHRQVCPESEGASEEFATWLSNRVLNQAEALRAKAAAASKHATVRTWFHIVHGTR
jgi:hypothetical protein